jgi:hypothetical protein
MVWSHYIYQHVRKDTGAVFYVGKGSYRKNRSPSYERAYDKTHARNPLWKNIANKHGFDVVIFAHCITDEDVDTNRIYPSIQEAADQFGYKMKTLYNWLSGHRKNPTHLRFA